MLLGKCESLSCTISLKTVQVSSALSCEKCREEDLSDEAGADDAAEGLALSRALKTRRWPLQLEEQDPDTTTDSGRVCANPDRRGMFAEALPFWPEPQQSPSASSRSQISRCVYMGWCRDLCNVALVGAFLLTMAASLSP